MPKYFYHSLIPYHKYSYSDIKQNKPLNEDWRLLKTSDIFGLPASDNIFSSCKNLSFYCRKIRFLQVPLPVHQGFCILDKGISMFDIMTQQNIFSFRFNRWKAPLVQTRSRLWLRSLESKKRMRLISTTILPHCGRETWNNDDCL